MDFEQLNTELELLTKTVNVMRTDCKLAMDLLGEAVDKLMQYDLAAATEITKKMSIALKRADKPL